MVKEKVREIQLFTGSANFTFGQGNMKTEQKVREKSQNFSLSCNLYR